MKIDLKESKSFKFGNENDSSMKKHSHEKETLLVDDNGVMMIYTR